MSAEVTPIEKAAKALIELSDAEWLQAVTRCKPTDAAR